MGAPGVNWRRAELGAGKGGGGAQNLGEARAGKINGAALLKGDRPRVARVELRRGQA